MTREVVRLLMLVFVLAPLVFVAGLAVLASGILGVGGQYPEPPEAALTHEGRRVEPDWSSIGCWSEKRPYLPDREACIASEAGVRAPGEPLPDRTPRVGRGGALRFTTDWPHAFETVSARAVRVDEPPDDELAMEQDSSRSGEDEGAHYMPIGYEVLRVPVRRDMEQTQIVADLPPGDYLVSVRMDVDDQEAVGEAYYDFEIVVEE